MRSLVSPEAEAGVIGALIVDSELCETIGSFLDRAHFYDKDLGALYALCLRLRSQKKKIDVISLSDLEEHLPSGMPTIARAGEVAYHVPSAANGTAYAQIVLERAKARRLNEVGLKIQAIAKSRGQINSQIADAQALVMGMDGDEDSADVIQMSQALLEVMDDMQATYDGVDVHGDVKSGLCDVDRIIGGYRKGTLNIVAGRPGSGKSLLANMIARNAAIDQSGSALVFTLEMSSKELAKRQLASVGNVQLGDIDSAKALDCDTKTKGLNVGVGKVAKADLRICDRSGLDFNRLCSIARFQHRVHPLDVIIVDYIGLIAPSETSRFQNRNQELGIISRGLKQLARELDVPVVALAQLNRGIEGRTDAVPKMSDLRDSGEIEQDADTIMICHRKDDERGRNGITLAEVVKVRHGQTGGALIQLQGSLAKFVNAADLSYEEYMKPPAEAPKPEKKTFF